MISRGLGGDRSQIKVDWQSLNALANLEGFWHPLDKAVLSVAEQSRGEQVCFFKSKIGKDMLILARPSAEAPTEELPALVDASRSMIQIFSRKL